MIKQFTMVLILVLPIIGIGQTVKGTCTQNGEPMPFVDIRLTSNGVLKKATQTDFDGNYKMVAPSFGVYSIEASYDTIRVVWDKLVLSGSRLRERDFSMEKSDSSVCPVVLTDRDGGASGATVTREDISKMPKRSAISITTYMVDEKDKSSKLRNRKKNKKKSKTPVVNGGC
jgi:hypothetical protein